jgi:ribulose-bisphosphate carboxylase large chain
MTIFPGFDAGYFTSKDDCLSVAKTCRQPWGHLLPAMPAVGGRIGSDRIAGLAAALGHDLVFILGSRIQQDERGVVAAIEAFQLELTRWAF